MRGAQFRRKIRRAMSDLDSSKFHTGVSGNQRKDESSNISHFRNCVEVMQYLAEIPSRGFQKQMVVVRHQTEAVDLRAISFRRRFQITDHSLVVLLT